MSTSSSFVYRKAKSSKVVTFITTSLSIGFGLFMFVMLPIVPYNYIFIAVSFLLPLLAILSNHHLVISDGKVKYSSLLSKWAVELNEIEEWKILGSTGGIGGHSLLICTKSGTRRSVSSLTELGVRNPDQFAHDFAKCIRDARHIG